jgi:hypothetical protein
MANNPKAIESKINTIIEAWKKLATAKVYGGMKLEEFQKQIAPSIAARATIADLEKQLMVAINARDEADKVSMEKITLVVNGVVGDPGAGPNSDLYEAMGYVRKSERKTGLTRKKSTVKKNS